MKEFNKHVQDAAEMFLKRRGCEVLDTNWKCPDGGGKFDIIADDEDSIVFVQVKGRDGRVEGFGFDEATMEREDFECSRSGLPKHQVPYRSDSAIRTVKRRMRKMKSPSAGNGSRSEEHTSELQSPM